MESNKNINIGGAAMKKINSDDMMSLLDSLYNNVVQGVPKVSKPVEVLALDYVQKYKDKETAINKLLKNQVTKCTVSGFMSGLGGAITLPVAVSADIASVLYVQMRMIAATAYISGFDLESDQTHTFVYACLAGVSVDKVLADAGIKFATKYSTALIKKIPGDVIKAINQKVGFRLVTKFGEKGIINLGRIVPVAGGIVGGAFNLAETKIIANRAYKVFFKDDILAFGSEEDIDTINVEPDLTELEEDEV